MPEFEDNMPGGRAFVVHMKGYEHTEEACQAAEPSPPPDPRKRAQTWDTLPGSFQKCRGVTCSSLQIPSILLHRCCCCPQSHEMHQGGQALQSHALTSSLTCEAWPGIPYTAQCAVVGREESTSAHMRLPTDHRCRLIRLPSGGRYRCLWP